MDRAYSNLLAHLHKATPSLSLTTIQSALAHYLANLSPLPTPLAASAVSSPLYLTQPLSNEKLQSLLTAFRHATHLRYRKQRDDFKNRSRLGNIFSKSLAAALGQWVDDVVKGIQGGHPVLRLSSLSGLFLGIHDLEAEAKRQANETGSQPLHLGGSRNIVEDELIVAVAEIMDTYSYGFTEGSSEDWEREFQPMNREILTLALVIASQSLPLVSQAKFDVLPLPALNHLTVSILSSTFRHGNFLHDLPASVIRKDNDIVSIPPASPVAKALHSISVSPVMTSAASLSRLAANSLRSRLEGYSDSKKSEGLRSALETLQVLGDIAMKVEQDWSVGPLAGASDHEIAPDTRPITQTIWTTLKTLLFSTIMLSDAILASVVYIQPGSTPYTQASTSSSELALRVLQILSHFAFVISQFGGVTSTSRGFEQLKKTFYLALDILVQEDGGNQKNENLANRYVKDQCFALKSSAITQASSLIQSAKKALVLASIEQLVPVLSEECIREYVFDVCWPHLSDPSHRETFESAHSVILAVFASHAQKQQCRPCADHSGLVTRDAEDTTFVKRMVPFYAHCLIENSAGGKLSTPQLRMAYAALVRCASASGLNVDPTRGESFALSWYCIQSLLDAVRGCSAEKEKTDTSTSYGSMNLERLQRLHMTLISAMPSLPLPLMLRVLGEIKKIITSIPPSSISLQQPASLSPTDMAPQKQQEVRSPRDELVKSLFEQIMEHVGYREKSAVMQWWYENRVDLSGAKVVPSPDMRMTSEDSTTTTAS
ncbi:hypothetical protein AN958_00325 [Leucoagaricus sp. SymC.cos]|nr:hypothetical protein AN958_00325 [Leucoagaricus sp. SymC.cos]